MLMPFADSCESNAVTSRKTLHLIHSALLFLLLLLGSGLGRSQEDFLSPDGVRYRVERYLSAEFPLV